ncbi:nitronate monooxygenase [Paraburkholderia acidipaludis]|uniref:nitronate monooxygenase n=1 Tax=Paraburkholderia acidipaludis TaxID=660537 RepID=UPI0004807C48|nr:nitronate monooxygenase [Paraburkholderia acidipaludis]
MSSPLRNVQTLARTPLCEMLGCRYPILLAGMGGVSRHELVAAVAEAGGFGFLGMVREPLDLIRDEVTRLRQRTGLPFGVNLIPAATGSELLRQQIDLCIELRVPVVGLFWDVVPDVIATLRAAGILVVYQVGSVNDAQQAQQAGADALIVQGVEGGGHVRGRQPLAELLAQVLAVTDVPVAAAGGIGDGQDVARVLEQGAQAAVLGTVMIATHESFAHEYHKRRLVEAQASETVLTEAFHINWPPHAAVRVLGNSVTRGEHGDPFGYGRTVIGDEEGRPIYLFSTDSPLRSMAGDYEAMALYAGLGVGRVTMVEPAAERVARIVAQAAEFIRRLDAPSTELSSPVCYAAEFERENNEAVVARLDELLEAERAGARVTLETAAQTRDAGQRDVIEAIHRDEVKWCAMLAHAIRTLDGMPSSHTGAFYAKAMAIDDLLERLAFVNRGQAWVARKLREVLPLVNDVAIHRSLTEMLVAHELNHDRVEVLLGSAG